jgi:hypothetical protein
MGEEKRGGLTIDLTADLEKLTAAWREVVREGLREELGKPDFEFADTPSGEADGEPLPLLPLLPLPRDWIQIKVGDARHAIVGAHGRWTGTGLATYWLRLPWSAFPNEIAGVEDLKRLGVYDAYLTAIGARERIASRSELRS